MVVYTCNGVLFLAYQGHMEIYIDIRSLSNRPLLLDDLQKYDAVSKYHLFSLFILKIWRDVPSPGMLSSMPMLSMLIETPRKE